MNLKVSHSKLFKNNPFQIWNFKRKQLLLDILKQNKIMATLAKHTGYFLINEKGTLDMITYAPDQNYSGRKDSDQYALAQGLFIDEISHDLWLTEVKCYRVVGTPSGLQTIKDLKCRIIAKQTFDWDMSKPIGQRQSNLKKSSKWDECFNFYRNNKK